MLVLVATCAAFLPALAGRWLDWDDAELLLDEQRWRGLSPSHLSWMFTTFHMGPYQPLSWLSYAFDHELWGMDPRGYHATNILLHAASAVCLFFLARRLFVLVIARSSTDEALAERELPNSWIDTAAAATALFWSVHPLRVESVAWITERRDCLSGLFFLASLLAWLRYVQHDGTNGSRRGYRMALLFFVASLLSKGLGLVLPVVLVVLDVWPLRRFGLQHGNDPSASIWTRLRASIFEKTPFWIAATVAGVLAVAGQRVAGAMVEAETHGPLARCTQAVYGLAFYLRKTLWPNDIMVLDPLPVPFDTGAGRFLAAELIVVLIVVLLIVRRRSWPSVVVALACYAVLVAPVLGLVQTGSQLVASRYSYLPAIPLSLLAGGGLLLLARRVGSVKPSGEMRVARAAPILLLGAAVLVSLGCTTARECRTWHDTFVLWQHDLAIDPKSGPARRSLIVAWLNEGQRSTDPVARAASFQNALEEVRKGLEQGPDPMFHVHAAKVYSMMASDSPADSRRYLEAALDHAQRGVALLEQSTLRKPEVYETCGVILFQLDRPAEAVTLFRKALELGPSSAMRHGLLAGALLQSGHPAEAVAELETAHRLEPENTAVLLELGNARRANGETGAAIEAYRQVLSIKQSNLGMGAAGDEEYALAYQAIAELTQGR